MRARPRPRHGWLAPTASPHALARWGGSRHAAAQGTTLRRPRCARYGARKLTALSQVASPRAIGALSLHDATRVAELRARGACLGRASSGRRAGVERGRARAGALERSRLGPRTTCSWVSGRASGGASGGASSGSRPSQVGWLEARRGSGRTLLVSEWSRFASRRGFDDRSHGDRAALGPRSRPRRREVCVWTCVTSISSASFDNLPLTVCALRCAP